MCDILVLKLFKRNAFRLQTIERFVYLMVTFTSPAKTAYPVYMSFWGLDSSGPKEASSLDGI